MISKTYDELFSERSPSLRDVNNAIRCLLDCKKVFEDKYIAEGNPFLKDHYQRVFDLIDQEIKRIYLGIDKSFPSYRNSIIKKMNEKDKI